jgi:uncharacterized protein YbbK (DUF523 family)
MKIVSACLAGKKVRYDGSSKTIGAVAEQFERCDAIAVCPERLAGLGVPRPQHEIVGGDGADVLDGRARVMDNKGNDRTAEFIKGAEETLRIANEWGIKEVIFAGKSPSCG